MELLIKVLCCLFFPPIAVALHRKPCAVEVILNVVLWLLFCHVGGVVHAFFCVFCQEDTRQWKVAS